MSTNFVMNKKIAVKITEDENGYACMKKTLYFKNNMTLAFFNRWRWYFEYRQALFKVAKPRATIELTTISYDYVPEIQEIMQKKRNKHISNKRMVCKIRNRMSEMEKNWNEFFDIKEDDVYKILSDKLKYYEEKLKETGLEL